MFRKWVLNLALMASLKCQFLPASIWQEGESSLLSDVRGIGLQYGSMCGGIGLQYMTSVCISSWWGLDSRGSFLVHSRSLGLSRLLGICWAQWRPATCWGPSIEWDPPPGFPALFLIHRNQALALRSGPGSFSAGEVLNKHILNALIPDLSKAF